MKLTARFAFGLLAGATLAGCSSLAGVGGTDASTCATTAGRPCASIQSTYAARGSGLSNTTETTKSDAGSTPAAGAPVRYAPGGSGVHTGADPVVALRSNPRVLRGWFKAWEDSDGDLFSDTYVYMTADGGRWLVDYTPRRARGEGVRLSAPAVAPEAPTDSPAAPTPASLPPAAAAPAPRAPAPRSPATAGAR